MLYALDVLTIIESVQESPGVIIAAQTDHAKTELMAEMKAAGVEYEERIERLSQVEAPKPNKDWIYNSFNEFRAKHPWVGSDTVKPKSIVRDMWERVMTFTEYVNHYGLKRSEGVVLRYLSDVYKGLMQNIPADARTDEIDDLIAWLGAVVRQVDSSLIDEWERLLNPTEDPTQPGPFGVGSGRDQVDVSVVDNERAFRVMVRNQMFDWVQRVAARRGYDAFGSADDIDRVRAAMAEYYDEHDEVLLDAGARSPERFVYDRRAQTVTQILHDPDATNEWQLTARVDVDASTEAGRAVLVLTTIGRAVR